MVRLAPTLFVYAHYSSEMAGRFHDVAGWVMLFVAFLLLQGIDLPDALDHLARNAVPAGPGMSDVRRIHSSRPRVNGLAEAAPIAAFLCCVGLVARHTRSLSPTEDATAYKEVVRNAITSMPHDAGEWSGIDVPIPSQAQQLLRPTAYLSRQYVNRSTGESCLVVVVHCGDARSMLDHYPAQLLPGSGMGT